MRPRRCVRRGRLQARRGVRSPAREVAEVVGCELQRPPVRGVRSRRPHHPGVVDQDVRRPLPLRHELVVGAQIGEIERCDVYAVVIGRGGDVGDHVAASLKAAHREGHVGAGRRENAGRLDADTRGRGGHDRASAADVDAGDDLVGGGLKSEWVVIKVDSLEALERDRRERTIHRGCA